MARLRGDTHGTVSRRPRCATDAGTASPAARGCGLAHGLRSRLAIPAPAGCRCHRDPAVVTTSFQGFDLPGTDWLVVRGPLTGDAVTGLLSRFADMDVARLLLLDLSRTTELDAAALSAIAGIHGSLSRTGGQLLLLVGAQTRWAARPLEQLVGETLVIVDRATWGAQTGGWLRMMEAASAEAVSVSR